MRTTEIVQLWKKLYIFVETSLSMKLRAKDSVPKMYSFFLWLYSFLMVVQLFRNIHMRTPEFVQLWKKLFIFVQTPLSKKFRAKDSVPKMYSFSLWLYSFSLVVQVFKNIHMRTTEFVQVWKETVCFGRDTIVNEIIRQGQCTKDVQLFSLAVQLFKNIHMRTTGFVQLWKKLYIFVQTPLSMKLRAKDSVPKMYSFFPWLYSFLLVVQLLKNIHMRTTEFVQVWKKLYIFVQTPLSMKLRAKDSVPKMYSFSLWLYSFLMVVQLFKNIHMRTAEFVQVWKKTVHFRTNTIVNEIKSQGQCTKDVQLFSLVVQLFNVCTAFQKHTYEDHRICRALAKTVHFCTNIIVNEIKSQGQCTENVQLFSLVVQLFNGCTAF